jgi:broad specificity phosphatase PhoE
MEDDAGRATTTSLVRPVTTLLLVRHGETDWNRDGRWQGHSDTQLNDAGREQARLVAAEIGAVDVIYASDLARARETAEIIAAELGGLEVRLDERLRERSFGAWEGKTAPEIEAGFGEQHARWLAGEGAGADDAEPFAAFGDRVRRFLEDLLARHPDETVLVVAHGGSIRVIHALASGLDYVRDHRSIPGVANCAVARYAAGDGKLAPID